MLEEAKQHLSHLSHMPFHGVLVNTLAVELQKRWNGRERQNPADRVQALLSQIIDGSQETPL